MKKDYKEARSRRGMWGGGRTMHSPGSKCGPEPRTRKTTMNFLRQFQKYALKIDKHLNCIITTNIYVHSYMFRL